MVVYESKLESDKYVLLCVQFNKRPRHFFPLYQQTHQITLRNFSSMDSNVLQTTSPYFPSFIRNSSNPNLHTINLPYSADRSSIKLQANHRRLSPAKSIPKSNVYDVELQATEEDVVKEIVNPVYVPTPINRPLRTPHSG